MSHLNKNKVGLSLAFLIAFLHLVWAILVGVSGTIAQSAINWIMPLHFIDLMMPLTNFSFTNAIIFVIMGFVGGYIFGWLFAYSWNIVNRK